MLPDLLFPPPSAPLGLVFYEGAQFPAAYKGDAFVALIEPLSPHQLSSGDGRVTVTRFAEIAALHADDHRVELETVLGLAT